MLLRQMKYFLAAVYCKSFSEAAKQCYVSQPSFSLQIQQLEKELGVKLINRGNCNFSLTPAGENFLKPCERIVGDIQNLLQNMQHFAEKVKYLTILSVVKLAIMSAACLMLLTI